jgi:hypothetical protein
MSISVSLIDDAQSGGTTNSFEYQYFYSGYGFSGLPQAGDTLVVVIGTDNGNNEVTSVTDGKGNTYQQLPGAFVQSNSNGGSGNGYIMDVWYADNIVAATGTGLFVTVNTSGTASHVAASIFDVVGIKGGTKTAANRVDSSATSPLLGPSLNGGSSALYITAYMGFNTGSGNTAVGSPWSVGTGGSGNNVDLPLDGFENVNYAIAYLVGSGSQQASWTQSSVGLPAGVMGVTIGAAGNSYSATIPFLGSVRIVGSAPSGDPDPFVGTVRVIASAPAGLQNPYLGNVRTVTSAPAGDNNAELGQVVIVASAPSGDLDPYLGNVIEGT